LRTDWAMRWKPSTTDRTGVRGAFCRTGQAGEERFGGDFYLLAGTRMGTAILTPLPSPQPHTQGCGAYP
jgi:hypothetical protein